MAMEFIRCKICNEFYLVEKCSTYSPSACPFCHGYYPIPQRVLHLSAGDPSLFRRSSNYRKMLVFGKGSYFRYALEGVCKSFGIDYSLIPGFRDQSWVRDTHFVAPSRTMARVQSGITQPTRIYVREKTARILKKSTPQAMKRVACHPALVDSLPEKPLAYETTRYYMSKHTNIYDGVNHRPREHQPNVDDLINQKNIKKTSRPLEGGNLFKAINQLDKTYYFIGFNVILNEEDYRRMKHGLLGTPVTGDEALLIANHIARYKKIFDTDNVVVLPQWAYHLDLQMAYVGKSTFLVHSFKKMREFFQQHPGKYDERCLQQAMLKETVVDRVVKILQNCNFMVIKCCGSIYANQVFCDDTFQFKEAPAIFHNTASLFSSFMNGIDVYSQRYNKYLFITMDSEDITHKKYFIKLLERIGIGAVFLKMERGSLHMDPRFQINYLGGALRCQTNFLPMDCIDKVEAS